jgi:stage II sporulation protein D
MLLNCGTREMRAGELRGSGRNQQFAGLVLTLPGKIKRRYLGVLELKAKNGELIPVITMDMETAVASVVQAETTPGTSMEALKAQAVVSRSYFVAGRGRHTDFDFCDLTHCLPMPPRRRAVSSLLMGKNRSQPCSREVVAAAHAPPRTSA